MFLVLTFECLLVTSFVYVISNCGGLGVYFFFCNFLSIFDISNSLIEFFIYLVAKVRRLEYFNAIKLTGFQFLKHQNYVNLLVSIGLDYFSSIEFMVLVLTYFGLNKLVGYVRIRLEVVLVDSFSTFTICSFFYSSVKFDIFRFLVISLLGWVNKYNYPISTVKGLNLTVYFYNNFLQNELFNFLRSRDNSLIVVL